MQILAAILAISAICFVNCAEQKEEKPQKYDVGKILKDDKAVAIYVNCFISKGECTPEANEIKTILPEAFLKDCGNCEENLKNNTYKLLEGLLKMKPELYAELEKVYDPKGDLKKKFGGAPEEGKKDAEKKEGDKKKGEEEKKNEGEPKKEEKKKD